MRSNPERIARCRRTGGGRACGAYLAGSPAPASWRDSRQQATLAGHQHHQPRQLGRLLAGRPQVRAVTPVL